jgi:hypothetical protein
MRTITALVVGIVAGAAVTVPVMATATDDPQWKPDYVCWNPEAHKVNCRVDVDTRDDALIRFREVMYVDGEWWSTTTFWPQRRRGADQ